MACIHVLTNCLQAYEKGYKTQKDERSHDFTPTVVQDKPL